MIAGILLMCEIVCVQKLLDLSVCAFRVMSRIMLFQVMYIQIEVGHLI